MLSIKDKYKMSLRHLKHLKQKLFRGFSDRETWSLDYSLAKIIAPRLKLFKKLTIGVPDGLTQREWFDILDKMIASFEFASSQERWMASDEEYQEHSEGLQLFAKYYFYLWW